MPADASPRPRDAAHRSVDAALALTLFLACKSDPLHPSLLQDLAWRIPSLHSLPLPSLHFLLQATTLHHLLTSNLRWLHRLALTRSASTTPSSPSAAALIEPLVSLVERLCGYIASLAVCHPSPPALVAANGRLQRLLRLQVALHFLQATREKGAEWAEALTRALFPALEQPARAVQDEEAEVEQALRALLVERSVELPALLQRFPYSAFEAMWRLYYSLCQQTPTFTDIDLELKAHFATAPPIPPVASLPLPIAGPASPPSPRQASPVPRRPPLEAVQQVELEEVVIEQEQVSPAEMYAMLRSARAGVTEDEVKREWQSIVEGTHPEVVQWLQSRQARSSA